MSITRIFLDTSVVKHSFREKRILQSRLEQFEWKGTIHDIEIHDFVTVDPISKVDNTRLRTEIECLTEIARLAREKVIELLFHHETHIEFLSIWSIPNGGQPELLQAGVTYVKDPIPYSRLLGPIHHGAHRTRKDLQIEFFKKIEHPRYLEIQKACGAYQGASINGNQLIDAFHIWCAEAASATHFLTTDFKLTRLVQQCKLRRPQVKVVTPTQLLADLNKQRDQVLF